jgi:hypothetical protein
MCCTMTFSVPAPKIFDIPHSDPKVASASPPMTPKCCQTLWVRSLGACCMGFPATNDAYIRRGEYVALTGLWSRARSESRASPFAVELPPLQGWDSSFRQRGDFDCFVVDIGGNTMQQPPCERFAFNGGAAPKTVEAVRKNPPKTPQKGPKSRVSRTLVEPEKPKVEPDRGGRA